MEEVYQDPQTTARDIKYLREWIAKQPHLPQQHDDAWLERFLYGCKYSVEKCKKVLENQYTGRSIYPQYFAVKDPTSPEARQMCNIIYRFALPDLTPEGYRVLVFGLLTDDVTHYTGEMFLQREVLFYTSLLSTDKSAGYIALFNMHGGTMAHLSSTLPHFKALSAFVQDMLPLRIKQVHLVHAPALGRAIMNLLKPFLSEKMKNRIVMHGSDFDKLYEYLPKKILPNEFGGQAGSIKELNESWQKRAEDMREFFLKELNKRTDESKRPAESARNDLFGTDGTFKTLNVD